MDTDRNRQPSSIRRQREALPSSSGIFSFLPEKLAFYEARGWIDLHDADKAASAADRAVSLYDLTETTEPALVRFERASAFAQAGDLTEACRTATEAILDRHTYRSVSVVTRAGEFDRTLGPSSNNAVRDWREILAGLRPPQRELTIEPEWEPPHSAANGVDQHTSTR